MNWSFGPRDRRCSVASKRSSALAVTRLEDRATPSATNLLAEAYGAGAIVYVYAFNSHNANHRSIELSFTPFYGYLPGGVRVATGDVTGDGVADVITAAGMGGGPHVKVWDGAAIQNQSLRLVAEFMAYDLSFFGGIYVAAGQVDPSTLALEIITGAGEGGGPHVKTFSIEANGGVSTLPGSIGSFMTYDLSFRGGVRVATAGFDILVGDEIITGAGIGGGPHVKVFRSNGSIFTEYMAFDASYRGGIYVTGGDTVGGPPRAALPNGELVRAEVAVGAGSGGGGHVRLFGVFQTTGGVNMMAEFQAGGDAEVRVGFVVPQIPEGHAKALLVVARGPGGGRAVSFYSFEPPYLGMPYPPESLISGGYFNLIAEFNDAPLDGIFLGQ